MSGGEVWGRERVLALCPDAAARLAANEQSVSRRWSSLGASEQAVWGRCRGSARTPYETVVAVTAQPVFRCSCPSRRSPCKHALGLLLLWSAGGVPPALTEPEFAAQQLRGRTGRGSGSTTSGSAEPAVADPEAAARRAAARAERVSAGLGELDLWLTDQIRGGLAGLERAGHPHFERMAARMVDAQAPGVAAMLRAIPGELTGESWPERVLERLAAVHLLIQAHRRLDRLPPELAANVRSRIGYPVTKAQVLATPGVGDQWLALGLVDSLEAQLETRRVWLYGTTTRRWAMWLSFAVPGTGLDATVLPGQLVDAVLHFYPGSSSRALFGDVAEDATTPLPDVATPVSESPVPETPVPEMPVPETPVPETPVPETPVPETPVPETPVPETFAQVQQRFARLLATDPWATRLPAVVRGAPLRAERAGQPWRLRDADGHCLELGGLAGEPWTLLARSGGEPLELFGEWAAGGFRALSALPDRWGSPFTTELAA